MAEHRHRHGRGGGVTGRRWYAAVAAVAVVASTFTVAAVAPTPASAALNVVVNSVGDAPDATPGDGVCETATAGECTLRAAIQETSAVAGADTISFAISGPGVHRIAPLTALPFLSGVTIDGYTQPGSSPNTLAQGSNAVLRIELHGGAVPTVSDTFGLVVTTPDTVIRGLVINGYANSTGSSIYSFNAPGLVVEGNFIGTDASGTAAVANTYGVRIEDNAVLGGTPSRVGGTAPAQRNVISGNAIGVSGWRQGNTGLTVEGNLIGTNAAGTGAVGNNIGVLALGFFSESIIGGTAPGAGNVISGNQIGINVRESIASVLGNRIGTDITGLAPLGNTVGINIVNEFGFTPSTLTRPPVAIGDGTVAGRNVIAASATDAVQVQSLKADVRGNFIGVGVDGTTPLGNGRGVLIGVPGWALTGPSSVGGLNPGDGNVIAFSAGAGVYIDAPWAGNRILGNSMRNNAGPGIQLASGANNDQERPVLDDPTATGADLQLAYTLTDDAPLSTFPVELDVYLADRPGAGAAGRTYLGRASVAAPGAGVVTIPGAAAAGNEFVVTATDAAGNTSPFSAVTSLSPGSLAFNLSVAPGSSATVAVAPAGIVANTLDPKRIGDSAGSNLAAAPITSVGPQDTGLASIPIGATPLSSIVINSAPLSSIPLLDVRVEGGWEAILVGSVLAGQPPSALTLGQVLGTGSPTQPGTPAGRIAALPLSSIDVGGTPLSSIPLSSIALGSTPLSSIPLSSIGIDWCDVVRSIVPGCTPADLAQLTVMEITLRGVPLSSIPLSSIPLSSIPLSSIPLSSIPLSSIDLSASPLSSIPLSSIPLSSIDVNGTPLSSIPLSSIPLSSTPLSSIPLSSIALGSTPLSSIPLSSIGPSGTPLSSIDVAGTPLSSIPLSSILLAGTPLSSIPLSSIGTTDWCAVLAAAGTRFDCTTGADPATTTLRDLTVRGVPLSSIPLSSIPLSSIPLSASPLSSIPLSSIPLSSIPLSSIPLSSIALGSTPLSSIPLSSIQIAGTPLSSIPLSSIPLSSIPLSSIPLSSISLSSIPLSSIPLSSIPLSSIPLSSITVKGAPLSSVPLSSINVLTSPLSSIPLSSIPLSSIGVRCGSVDCARGTVGDAYRVGALPPTTTLGQIQPGTAGIRLGSLLPFVSTFTTADLLAGLTAATGTVDLTRSDVTLGELPSSLYGTLTLGSLGEALTAATFADLVGALTDPTTGAALTAGTLRTKIDARGGTLGSLARLGDVTLGDLLAPGGPALTLNDIEPLLGLITVDAFQRALGAALPLTGTLAGLTPQQLGRLTLADLSEVAQARGLQLGELLTELGGAGLLTGFTLGDLLMALVDPGSLANGGVDFSTVNVASLPAGTVDATEFSALLTLTSTRARTVEVEVSLPSGARYVGDRSTVNGVAAEPVVNGNVLVWTVVATPDTPYDIRFQVLPTLRLGSSRLYGNARLVGTDVSTPTSSGVTVADGLEPNDFQGTNPTDRQTTLAANDTIYLPYIASAADVDVFQIDVAENDRLDVQLANLDADLDVALWRRPTSSTLAVPLAPAGSEPPLFPLVDPDGAPVTEPLRDFPRLDALDAEVQLVTTSNRSGTADETISTERLAAGRYYVQVYGANGATNVSPASLQLKVRKADEPPVCRATDLPPAPGPFPAAPTISATANTLILVNPTRLQQVYGGTAGADVVAATGRLTAYLAAHPGLGLTAVVVPVDAYPSVRAAYEAWDATVGSCDPEAANAVVKAISAEVLDGRRNQFRHIAILGSDQVIPMARLHDGTLVANEYDFRHEFDGKLAGPDPTGANAATASFWNSVILSDEPYGETSARSLGDRFLYTTDVALGRVVETPGEIAAALDAFAANRGSLSIDSAAVLGYDFLADGSDEIGDRLEGAGLPTDRRLAAGLNAAGQPWTRADATAALVAAGTNALVSLNAHFDHYRALPAAGDKVTGFQDFLVSSDAAGALGPLGLNLSLVFSMGCHSGLSVSDSLIASTSLDWAQTMSRQNAIYVANTGFGYGDTVTVAYSERLMELFAGRVTAPLNVPSGSVTAASTVGEALAWAKNDYVAALATISVYDEKALMESTFYGLPFYRVGLTATPLAAPPTTTTAPDATGTPANRVVTTAVNTATVTPLGTYYANPSDTGEQAIVAPGRPIEPKTVRDVSVVVPTNPTQLAQVARGAMVLDMDSTYVPLPNPVIATPVFDTAGRAEPPVGDVAFPAKPVEITTVTGPAGTRQQLVLATGQYRSDTGLQRLDTNIDTVVYYAAPGQTDVTSPTIGVVDAVVTGGRLALTANVTDVGTGADRVYALVTENPGVGTRSWTGVDLVRDGSSTRWTASLALTPGVTDVEFLVQAKDDAGNVGVASNKARNFDADPPAVTPPPPPPATLQAQPSGTPGTSGYYTSNVRIDVVTSGPATYSVDGVDRGPVPSGNSFVITGEGLHRWTVIAADGYTVSGTVLIDTVAPVVTGARSTAANGAGWNNGPIVMSWSVDDPAAVRPPDSAVTQEGAATTVTSAPACDQAGNCATGSVTVKLDLTAPTGVVSTSVNGNEFDWNNGAVTVNVACADALSGVATCPAPTVLSTEGVYGPQSFSVVDVAGNSTSVTSRPINIDLTPPVVTLASPANGSVVPQASYVRPTCSATDALSGLDGTCSVRIGDPVTVVGGYTETVTATAGDKAGNTTTTAAVTYTVRTDAAGPVIDPTATPLPNAAGWWKTPVTYQFACIDSSGVATCPPPRTVSTPGANQSFTVAAADVFGNGSQLTVSAINIDLTAPVVTVTAPTSVTPLDTVTITCAASDALSGVAAATCADRTFAASTLQPGANVFTFSATDVAGNTTTVSKTITLVVPANAAPTVRADMGVAGLEEIGFQTNIVIVNGTFSDPGGPGPYTASVRWAAGGTFTPLALAGNGTFVAANIYASAGVRTVTVRICDAGGACGTDDMIVRSGVTQRVRPVRECVTNRGASVNPRYAARWGYDNPATFAIAVASVPILENTFTAAPFLRGQPQIFLPGQQRGVFTTTFASGTQTWRLNGTTASATTTSPAC